MQLNLGSFNEDKTTKTRIEESIASNLKLKGLENIPELSDTLRTIFANYELEKGVFKLKNETCENCRHKLKRKGTYDKEIILPGGAQRFRKLSKSKQFLDDSDEFFLYNFVKFF